MGTQEFINEHELALLNQYREAEKASQNAVEAAHRKIEDYAIDQDLVAMVQRLAGRFQDGDEARLSSIISEDNFLGVEAALELAEAEKARTKAVNVVQTFMGVLVHKYGLANRVDQVNKETGEITRNDPSRARA